MTRHAVFVDTSGTYQLLDGPNEDPDLQKVAEVELSEEDLEDYDHVIDEFNRWQSFLKLCGIGGVR